jgi:hypothetical protein
MARKDMHISSDHTLIRINLTRNLPLSVGDVPA